MNFNLPEQTHVHTFIPKNTFFSRAVVNTKLKKEFTDAIQKITWEYKLAPDTVGIVSTESVEEIQIFYIELKEQVIPKNVLKLIDKTIAYPILYRFIYKDHEAFGITLRTVGDKKYYFTEWDNRPEFRFTGQNLERVYEGLVEVFIGQTLTPEKDFVTIVEQDKEKGGLEREIQSLQKKLKSEPHFNRQVEINTQLQGKKNALNTITNQD